MRAARLAVLPLVLALIVVTAPSASQSQEGVAPISTEVAERLAGAALLDDTAWRRLEHLCDRIGHRLSGSAALDAAIDWAVAEMKKDGLDNVRKERVLVPRWVRGRESAELVAPASRPLAMLGLGNSVGTPADGVTADVAVVRDWKELEALGDGARGKIVLFDAKFTTYGETVAYRAKGPSEAARRGAVAALVRSVGPVSLRTPHTGTLRYQDDAPKIPAAALSIEDAETLARLRARGERVRVRLKMEAKLLEDVESANVVGEVTGREKPEEVVLVGGHLDSWDVGQGAQDDGTGCLAAWEAVRQPRRLGLRPRRTLRVVLFTNEENGLRGAAAYRDAHGMERHALAIEADLGAARPTGFGLAKDAPAALRAAFKDVASVLRGIGCDRIDDDGGGADVGPLHELGYPVAGLTTDPTRYFEIHHTEADTLDKVDRTDFGRCAAAMAVAAWGVADHPSWPVVEAAAKRR